MSEAFERLSAFLSRQMRMSHVYQPLMLRRLLVNGGVATRQEIARDILNHDPTQLEYYETIVRDMVGRVLTSKGDMVQRDGTNYSLPAAGMLSPEETAELIRICDAQVADFDARRGRAIWEHRRRGRRPVPGSLRYEVLKRATFRCELCGIPAAEKHLEVDHIIPRNHGGGDELINLQALCFTCNASKRDRDDTDFRGMGERFAHREQGCLFCDISVGATAAENRLAVARRDGFPVTEGHTLIIPKRHVADYFDLTQPELNAIYALLSEQKDHLRAADAAISGFNIGVNSGAVAGQTIMHCHVHLIPRRPGDVSNPRGGVRHVIPGKGDYAG